MNIAIVHYHLNRSGVTQVVMNQLLALDRVLGGREVLRAAIFFGGRDKGWPADFADKLKSINVRLVPIPRLDYDTQPIAEPHALADELRQQLRKLDFAPHETVLHVHNHSLGKNVSLPGALRILAEDGFAQLLQIHDFAEDFRPRNYRRLCDAVGRDDLTAVLYPQASHLHYAVLNRRDQRLLSAAGFDKTKLHFLPNPVLGLGQLPSRAESRGRLRRCFGIADDQRYVLYPVRGIRRKNLGEALLWSLLAGEKTAVGITLAPLNPVEQSRYAHWKKLAIELGLLCFFETGSDGKLLFEENLSAADLILTTSTAEGFGMVFLESWLAGRTLTGRNLPEVTADFVETGICFDTLYDRLNVPIGWIGRDKYLEILHQTSTVVMKSYGYPAVEADRWECVIDAKIRNGFIDFADLHEPLQESVIRRVAGDPSARRELLHWNPAASNVSAENPEVVRRNKQLIQHEYSLEPSGHRLEGIYQAVQSSPRSTEFSTPTHGNEILSSLLELTRFRLIRGEP